LKQNKNEKEGKIHSISNRVISIVDAIFSSIKSRKAQISTLRENLCNQGIVQAFVQTGDKHKTFVRPAELERGFRCISYLRRAMVCAGCVVS
jgi:hypothetical protein